MSETRTVEIRNKKVGPNRPCYVVAEISGNHLGDLDRAKLLIKAAAEAGADAVKTQAYSAADLTIEAYRPEFIIPKSQGGPWANKSLWELYSQAGTPLEWSVALAEAADEIGIPLITTPFSLEAVDRLPMYAAIKVASFEIGWRQLLETIAAHHPSTPVILSTGMASFGEIDRAVSLLTDAVLPVVRRNPLVLLRCVSAYPADPEEARLWLMGPMERIWRWPVGFSDHTLGIDTAVAAAAMGAKMIEKHFTLSRSDGGPDAHFSAEPAELAEMVRRIRALERHRGAGPEMKREAEVGPASDDEYLLRRQLGPSISELRSMPFRRSLFFVRDVKAFARIEAEDVAAIRPGYGLDPWRQTEVTGKIALYDIPRGTPVTEGVYR